MRKKLNRFTFVFLVLSLLLIACSGGKPGDEPNNTIEEAAAIVLNEPFEIKIDPKGDIDWFKVELSEQGYLIVQANNVPEDLVIETRFALYEEWEGQKDKEIKGWTKVPSVLHVPEAGTYYFAIIDDYNDKFSTDPINIKVEFVKEFDSFEFNDSPEMAKELKFGDAQKIYIYPNGDNDWFKINMDKKGYIKTMIKNKQEGVVPEIKFVKVDDWSSNEVKELRGWGKLPNACYVVDTGMVYMIIHDDYDDASSQGELEFKVDFIDDIDINEPNEIHDSAKLVKRNDTLNLAIFPSGDKDFYKIQVDEGDKLNFMAKDWGEGIVPEIRLYTLDTLTNKLADFSAWIRLPTEIDVENGKLYYFLIHDDYDDKGSEKLFQVLIK